MERHGSPTHAAVITHVSVINGAQALFPASFMSLSYRRRMEQLNIHALILTGMFVFVRGALDGCL